MERKKIKKFSWILLIILITLLVTIFIYTGFSSLFFGTEFLNPNCYVEKHYFISEEIKQTDLCPDNCLYIYSYKLLANDPHVYEDKYRKVYRTYYFAKEQDLIFNGNISIDEEFNVRWCKIKGIGERIKGVWK